MPSPFKFIQPANNITTVTPGGIASITFDPLKRIAGIVLVATATKAAGGAGVTSVPAFTDAIQQYQFKVGSSAQRTRLASEIWGAAGLNALCDANNGGTVMYQQGGANITTKPVLIGSAADTAAQAALAANTATTAWFYLPILFAEPFRKSYLAADILALYTGFDDKTGIGQVTLDVTIANNANISGITLRAKYEYDELVQKAGTVVQLSKEYRFPVQYAAAGDIEVALQIKNVGILQRVSLLTAADRITRVVVKQGNRVLRDLYDWENQQFLINNDFNPAAIVANRYDIEFDINDDPNSAPLLDPSAPLSIVATLATANDASKNIWVLVSNYGSLD